mmetsp:Transcript_16780/g.52446  ORF Transcript_16780/g.52446 Transcript_16780/m.52446 type:complete len:211 (+) Transcript_16780:466-1098(+)
MTRLVPPVGRCRRAAAAARVAASSDARRCRTCVVDGVTGGVGLGVADRGRCRNCSASGSGEPGPLPTVKVDRSAAPSTPPAVPSAARSMRASGRRPRKTARSAGTRPVPSTMSGDAPARSSASSTADELANTAWCSGERPSASTVDKPVSCVRFVASSTSTTGRLPAAAASAIGVRPKPSRHRCTASSGRVPSWWASSSDTQCTAAAAAA